MRNYIQPGKTLTFTAPAGDVVSGGGYVVGALFNVSNIAAAAGDRYEGDVEGVFDLPKATGIAFAEGEAVFWDNTNKLIKKSASTYFKIGAATAASVNGDTTQPVRLDGITVTAVA